MIKFTCDRCGKALDNIYYTVDINAHSINDYYQNYNDAITTMTAVNAKPGIWGYARHYCLDCKVAIENFLKEVVEFNLRLYKKLIRPYVFKFDSYYHREVTWLTDDWYPEEAYLQYADHWKSLKPSKEYGFGYKIMYVPFNPKGDEEDEIILPPEEAPQYEGFRF